MGKNQIFTYCKYQTQVQAKKHENSRNSAEAYLFRSIPNSHRIKTGQSGIRNQTNLAHNQSIINLAFCSQIKAQIGIIPGKAEEFDLSVTPG